MRAVDLSCLLLSPICAGGLMTWAGLPTTVWIIFAWNAAAWAPELGLLWAAYSRSARLQVKGGFTYCGGGREGAFLPSWGCYGRRIRARRDCRQRGCGEGLSPSAGVWEVCFVLGGEERGGGGEGPFRLERSGVGARTGTPVGGVFALGTTAGQGELHLLGGGGIRLERSPELGLLWAAYSRSARLQVRGGGGFFYRASSTWTGPTGRPRARPQGDPIEPQGDPIEPQGDPIEPQGDPIEPQGDPIETLRDPAPPPPGRGAPPPRRRRRR